MRTYLEIYRQIQLVSSNLSNDAGLIKNCLFDLDPYKYSKKTIRCDLYCSSKLLAENRALELAAQQEINAEEDFSLNIFSDTTIPIRRLGDRIAAVAIVSAEDCLSDNQLLYWDKNAGQYAMLVILNSDANSAPRIPVTYKDIPYTLHIPRGDSNKKIMQILGDRVSSTIFNVIWQKEMLNSVQPVLSVISETIKNEIRIIALHQTIVNQMTALLDRKKAALLISTKMYTIKQQMQDWAMESSGLIRTKYEQLFRIDSGRYSGHLKDWSSELTQNLLWGDSPDHSQAALHVELQSGIKSVGQYAKKIAEELESDFTNDRNLILSMTDSFLGRMNYQLMNMGITLLDDALRIDYSDFPLYPKLNSNPSEFDLKINKISTSAVFTRAFVSEPGFWAFLSILFFNAMIAAIHRFSAPWPAPLAALGSTILKLNTPFYIASVSISLCLIGWVIIHINKRAAMIEKRDYDRSLRDIRNLLINKGKTIYGQASANWIEAINNWVEKAHAQLSEQLALLMHEYDHDHRIIQNEERSALEQQKQNLASRSARIKVAERILLDTLDLHKKANAGIDDELRDITSGPAAASS